MSKVFDHAYGQMIRHGQLFAVATVVRSIKPSSSKAGDKAVIDTEGEIHGWIGGGCTQSIVVHECLQAIKTRRPILVRITPGGEPSDEPGIKTYKMTCQSGGTVDVFVEPHVAKPQIIVAGQSAIAESLIKLANEMEYPVKAVSVLEEDRMPKGIEIAHNIYEAAQNYEGFQCIIVATQGDLDEERLVEALKVKSSYLAFVSSRRKAQSIYTSLRKNNVDLEDLKRIKTPAGLDLGAQLPGEVAISILAEIVQVFRAKRGGANPQKTKEQVDVKEENDLAQNNEPPTIKNTVNRTTQPNMIVNPVCGIPIMLRSAKHIEEKNGQLMYFCCNGCKITFDKNPDQYWQKLNEQIVH